MANDKTIVELYEGTSSNAHNVWYNDTIQASIWFGVGHILNEQQAKELALSICEQINSILNEKQQTN